jgi:hypothetical protein
VIRVIAESLGPSPTYTRREMRAVVGGVWPDGRDATVVLDVATARDRYRGRRANKTVTSGYAVARVPAVGHMGHVIVWDKLFPADEHGEGERADIPKPPYTVRIDQYGEVSCTCMAGNCKAPSCRHIDASLVLIDDGEVFQQPQGA